MEMLPAPTERIDLRLLDEVERRLQELIDVSTKLDLPEPERRGELVPLLGQSMDANHVGWQDRLAELSRQTAELELELTAQEQSLRQWFEAIAARKKLLENIAG